MIPSGPEDPLQVPLGAQTIFFAKSCSQTVIWEVDLALESTQCFMTVFDTMWPIYSESGSCHSGTVGEIEILKMATTNVKNITIAITS